MLFGLPQEPVRPSPQRTLSQRKSVIDRFLWKPSDDTMLHVLTPDGIAPQTKQAVSLLPSMGVFRYEHFWRKVLVVFFVVI
jgi:hypothetical protein